MPGQEGTNAANAHNADNKDMPRAENPTATPSKTTIRYINDTLFASNFGSMLVSLVNGSKPSSGTTATFNFNWTILSFGLFFVVFRIKAYLDDNNSLMNREEEHRVARNMTPNAWEKAGFVVALISWLCYSLSGFFIFTNLDYAHKFLGLSFGVFSIWILISFAERDREDKAGATPAKKVPRNGNHKVYLICNLFYLFFLSFLVWGYKLTSFSEIIGLAGLFVSVFLDYVYSKSLDHCYR